MSEQNTSIPHKNLTNILAMIDKTAETQAAFVSAFAEGRKLSSYGQKEHSIFILWAIIRLIPNDLDENTRRAIHAFLSANGAGGNASQFRQFYSKAKNGSLLPSAEQAADIDIANL